MARWLILVALVAGCGGFGDETTPPTDGGTIGYGKPTLQITVNGATTGQLVPNPGSFVDVADVADFTSGRITQSSISIAAAATTATEQVSCSLSFSRFGEPTTPIGTGSHQVSSAGGVSGFSQVTPVGSLQVFGAGTSWSCGGSDCDGSVLQLQTVTADHVEGFWGGRLLREGGVSIDDVVCSFYVPTRVFQR